MMISGQKSWTSVTGFPVLAILLSLLAACVESGVRDAPPVDGSSEAPQSQPELPAAPDLAPQETLCEEDERVRIETTIDTQAQLIEAGDWPAAYLWASSLFRENVPVEDFELVVTRQYEQLLYFEGSNFGRCELVDSTTAIINVQIASRFFLPVIMVYTMVKDDNKWFVSGVDIPVSAIPNA